MLELDDIQGILLFGYAKLPAACFVLIEVTEPSAARAFVGKLAGRITNAHKTPLEPCVNIAFTHQGLEALGMGSGALATFPLEFVEGMTTQHRQRMLGDLEQNDPAKWQWGGPDQPAVHAVLMLYAPNDADLEDWRKTLTSECEGSGWAILKSLETVSLKYNKEHFGFRDGISEPVIRGSARHTSTNPESFNVIEPGEFILGYPNEYDHLTSSPSVQAASSISSPLKALPDGALDFGRNGSYMVFRQLEQDVQAFWKYCEAATKSPNGKRNAEDLIKLAAKMVGRWPSGAPFSESPESDPATPATYDHKKQPSNGFLYGESDRDGFKCPVGSHIRRSFPRDTLAPDKETAITTSKHHRIIRRGREYGEAIDAEMRPEVILDSLAPATPRGLHFICFNANISRQFEFIQDTWINNPNFQSLYSDPDPIASGVVSDSVKSIDPSTFTVQGCPVRRQLENLPSFVTTRGGAYFFLPGISALKHIGLM